MSNVITVFFGQKNNPAKSQSTDHFVNYFKSEINKINTSLSNSGADHLFFSIEEASSSQADIKFWLLPEFGEQCLEKIKVCFADNLYYLDWGDEILRYSRGEIASAVSLWASSALERHQAPVRTYRSRNKPVLSLV